MDYCNACAEKCKYPMEGQSSIASCELCGHVGPCFTVPVEQLPGVGVLSVYIAGVPLTEGEADALTQILIDAIGEFVTHRGPTAGEYVSRRYAEQSARFRQSKVTDVLKRLALASRLRRALTTLRFNYRVMGGGAS